MLYAEVLLSPWPTTVIEIQNELWILGLNPCFSTYLAEKFRQFFPPCSHCFLVWMILFQNWLSGRDFKGVLEA